MDLSQIMKRKSAVLLAIALSVGLISSGLHAAKKANLEEHNTHQVVSIKKA